VALFGYDDVLGERVLEEYEAESARWAERGKAAARGRRVDPGRRGGRRPAGEQRAALPARGHATSRSSRGCVGLRTGPSPTTVWSPSRRSSRRARAVRHRCSCPRKQVAWAWLGFRTRPDEATIAALLNARRTDGISIAVGEPAPGIAGFRNSHAEALAARRLAEALQASRRQRDALGQRRGPRAVVGGCGARAGIRVPRARAARRRRRRNGAAAGTLAVYFREGDVTAATAQRLGVRISTRSRTACASARSCSSARSSSGASNSRPRCCCAT
jgi:GGDEF-like domain